MKNIMDNKNKAVFTYCCFRQEKKKDYQSTLEYNVHGSHIQSALDRIFQRPLILLVVAMLPCINRSLCSLS